MRPAARHFSKKHKRWGAQQTGSNFRLVYAGGRETSCLHLHLMAPDTPTAKSRPRLLRSKLFLASGPDAKPACGTNSSASARRFVRPFPRCTSATLLQRIRSASTRATAPETGQAFESLGIPWCHAVILRRNLLRHSVLSQLRGRPWTHLVAYELPCIFPSCTKILQQHVLFDTVLGSTTLVTAPD